MGILLMSTKKLCTAIITLCSLGYGAVAGYYNIGAKTSKPGRITNGEAILS